MRFKSPMKTAKAAKERGATPLAGFTGTNESGLRGCVDGIDAGSIFGWLAPVEATGERCEVEILKGNTLVARGIADGYREDLLQVGIGDGKHGFSIALPADLADGVAHSLTVRAGMSSYVLQGSPIAYQAEPATHGDVWIDGGALVGTIDVGHEVDGPLVLRVIENGEMLCAGLAEATAPASTLVKFSQPLPAEVFDGRPHLFSVWGDHPERLLGELAVIMAHMITPEAALHQFAREGLKPRLSTMAGFRYDSLVDSVHSLQRCADTLDLPSALKQLMCVHERLIRGASDTDKDFGTLVFPMVEHPRASVVIPVHNKFPVTYHCLCSLLLATNANSFEVIIVDDGSTDVSQMIPELIQGVKYLRNDEAQGFIRACNAGAALACGDYIVMLNNDTEVTAGWLDELIWPFEHFDKVGMTGAKLIYPDGKLQEAGGIVWSKGDPWNYGRGANVADPRFNYARQVDYLSGACAMLPRNLWEELAGFDELFVPAYFEDTDLAFRVREKGLKTVYTPLSQVIHYEGVSNGTSTSSGIKKYQEINRPKFKERWRSACRHNGEVGVDLELNKDRNVEFRALVLDAETPMPDQNAGSYAAIQEIRMLQALGFKCTFVPMNMAWMGHYTESLQRMGVECVYAPFASSINEVVEKRGKEFDLIYITRFYVAQSLIEGIRRNAPQAKVVLNNADLHFLRELRAGLEAKSKEVIARAVDTREAELSTMRNVDLVLSYTEVERAVILSHNLDSTKVARCPWVTNVVPTVPSFESRKDIAFLGGFSHHPNAEAVEWFTVNVMPLLRQKIPDIKFHVYGSNVSTRLQELAERHESLVIEGWVPSVDAVYDACRVFVAPLRSGAGIKGKVIEALAYGVPSVISEIAAEGMALADGTDALIAKKPEEWVTAITRMYEDEGAWQSMSDSAQRFARRHFGFAQGVSAMRDALQETEIFASLEGSALVLDRGEVAGA